MRKPEEDKMKFEGENKIRLWKGILYGIIGAILITAVVFLTAGLYALDQYYLDKEPQKYLKALDID